jgi:hypothetical protein
VQENPSLIRDRDRRLTLNEFGHGDPGQWKSGSISLARTIFTGLEVNKHGQLRLFAIHPLARRIATPMKKIRILSLGTILVLGFALGAQAQTETTSENTTGDADGYQVGQPTSTSEQGKDAAPDQQTAPEPEQQATPAPAGNVTLNPDNWSVPPSL